MIAAYIVFFLKDLCYVQCCQSSNIFQQDNISSEFEKGNKYCKMVIRSCELVCQFTICVYNEKYSQIFCIYEAKKQN